PIPVVGHGFDDDGDSMWTVGFEAKLLDLGAAQLTRTALDRPLDVVLGHVGGTRLLHRQPQPVVTVRVATAFPGRDRDLACHLGELLALAGVGDGLLVLDRRPLGMTRHDTAETSNSAYD